MVDWRVAERELDLGVEERGLVSDPMSHGQPRIGRRRAFLDFLHRRLAHDRGEASEAPNTIWW